LSSLSSVEAFAHEFGALHLPLNLLINNAGIMATPFQQTVDGIDMQVGTNHLGHFCERNNCRSTRRKESAAVREKWSSVRLMTAGLVPCAVLCRPHAAADASAASWRSLTHCERLFHGSQDGEHDGWHIGSCFQTNAEGVWSLVSARINSHVGTTALR
jgi:hypothetical protein